MRPKVCCVVFGFVLLWLFFPNSGAASTIARRLSPAGTSAGYASAVEGLEDRPLPNMSGMTMNQRVGSSTPSGPTSHWMSLCWVVFLVGLLLLLSCACACVLF